MVPSHDLLVMAHHDPRERLMCPSCKTAFIGEEGFAFLTRYKREGDPEWTTGYLIYCGSQCVLECNPTEGSC